jgi:TP901 family phage tail tape measure protein
MATVRTVRVVLTVDNKGALKALTETGAASETLGGKLQAAGAHMASAGRTMTAMAVPLVALGAGAIKSASAFQDSMTLIRTQAGASRAEVDMLGKAALQMAPKYGYGPKQLADALYFVESAGYHGSKALGVMRAAAMGAQVGQADLTATTNTLTSVLNSGMKDVHGASDAMGVLSMIVGQGKMKMDDLNASLSTSILSTAKLGGVGLRDVGAEMAAMTRQGIPAVDAMTRFRMSLNQIEAPNGKALKGLTAIHLSQYQLSHDLRGPQGLIGAMSDLYSHLKLFDTDTQATVLSEVFGGSKSSSNVKAMLAALGTMAGIRAQLGGAGASALAGQFKVRQQDFSFKWEQFKSNLQVALVQLGDSLMPLVQKWLPKLTSIITGVVGWLERLPKPVKEVLMWATAFLAVGGPILLFAGKLVNAIGGMVEAAAAARAGLAAVAGEGAAGGAASALGILGKAAGFAGAAWLASGIGKQFASQMQSAINKHQHGRAAASGAKLGAIAGAVAAGGTGLALGADAGAFAGPLGIALGGAGGALIGGGVGLVRSFFAHGGPVGRPRYLASGGPMGSDTVPAWLTPGEYVLSANAAQAIGVGALNAINATGSLAGQGGGQTLQVTMPVVLKMGDRVLTEQVVHFAARRTALAGGYVAS